MKTRFNTSSKNKKHSILENSNFLNSQNYIISNLKKKYFINNFLILKYFSIINNRIIGTVLFSILIGIFAFIYPTFFHNLFLIILAISGFLIPFGIFVFFGYLVFKGKVYKNRDLGKKLNIFEISSPILSFKNILIEEKNQKLNLFKKIISFFIIIFLSILFSIVIFLILEIIYQLIFEGKKLIGSNFHIISENSKFGFLIIPMIIGFLIYLFKKVFNFISRIRVLPILLLPLFALVYLINLIYFLLKRKLNYYLILKKPIYSKKIIFTKLKNNYAENRYLLIKKK